MVESPVLSLVTKEQDEGGEEVRQSRTTWPAGVSRSLARRSSVVRSVVRVAFCLAALTPASAAPPRLAISFSQADVVISGVTPGGRVVLIGLAREPLGYYSNLQPFVEQIDDSDSDGITRYELQSANDWKSIWGAVDLQSGDYVVSRPDRSPGRQVNFKGRGLGRGANGKLSKLEHEGQWLELMLVRPTGDVFQALVVDGGPFDEDGRNDNVVNVSFDALNLAAGKGTKQDEYRAGDVLFVIDPDDLSMVAVKVK